MSDRRPGRPRKIEEAFWRFAETVTIASKDEGTVKFRPWGTQRWAISEMFRALADGRREIVIVKPRQVGMTTVMTIFDLFWSLAHKGLQGQLTADSDANKEFIRDLIGESYKTLPRELSWPLRQNNRNQIAWANGSRLLFQTANSTRLGRARGLTFHHGTEIAYWPGDVMAGLRAAFSEKHPASCFVYESTANGYNHFYDLWMDAQRAVTLAPIFIAWWRHEGYQLATGSKAFRAYWDGSLTADERAWQSEITRRWGVELKPNQWAWYRWKLAEKIGDAVMMHKEYPTLPEHAFQVSGNTLVPYSVIARLRRGLEEAPQPTHYRYMFGQFLELTELHPATAETAQLTVWEEPDPRGYYVIAGDPSYGASAHSDRSVAQVWKVTRTTMTQVAEFAAPDVTMQQFAWVLCHLAGAYTPNSHLILELNGPGMAVWQEIERLRGWGWGVSQQKQAAVRDALAGIHNFIFRRADSLTSRGLFQWKTTPQTKVWILSRLRDQLMREGVVTVRSREFIEELGNVRQQGDKFVSDKHTHDDRVITAALALEMWTSHVLPLLQLTVLPEDIAEPPPAAPAHEKVLRSFFAGIQARAEAQFNGRR